MRVIAEHPDIGLTAFLREAGQHGVRGREWAAQALRFFDAEERTLGVSWDPDKGTLSVDARPKRLHSEYARTNYVQLARNCKQLALDLMLGEDPPWA